MISLRTNYNKPKMGTECGLWKFNLNLDHIHEWLEYHFQRNDEPYLCPYLVEHVFPSTIAINYNCKVLRQQTLGL